MARIHDGLMMLLTVGRNRVLSLVACCFDVIYVHCDVAFVHCDVYFSMFFTALVRWIDVPLSLLLVHSSVHSSILCGSGTLWCGGSLLRIGRLFAFLRFLFFLGDHLSAWCDILKVSHAHRK